MYVLCDSLTNLPHRLNYAFCLVTLLYNYFYCLIYTLYVTINCKEKTNHLISYSVYHFRFCVSM